MNAICRQYGAGVITGVITDYIILGLKQDDIAKKRKLDQRGEVSPIIRGCNFNPNPEDRAVGESGRSRGIYKNGKQHRLKNGKSVPVTENTVKGFVNAWANNENLTFSEYMEITYGGTTPVSNGGRTAPISNGGSYGNGSTYGGDISGPSSGGEEMAVGCGAILFIIAAIYFLPKIPIIGGLFGGLFKLVGGLFGGFFKMLGGGISGLFFTLACWIAPFGEIVSVIGVIAFLFGIFLSKNTNTARMGAAAVFFGMLMTSLPSRNWKLSLVFLVISAAIYLTGKKN